MQKISGWISKMHPLEIILRVMFISIASIFFAFAAWLANGSIRTITTHEKFVAEVVQCSSNGSPNARFNSYDCRVRYSSAMGRHSATIENLLFKHDPGEQVYIYVGTGPMYSVKAGGFNGLWGVTTLLTILGSMFLAYGVWPDKKKGKKKRRTSRPPGGQPPISK